MGDSCCSLPILPQIALCLRVLDVLEGKAPFKECFRVLMMAP